MDTGRMLFTIDQSMRIERPCYTGNLLLKSADRIRKVWCVEYVHHQFCSNPQRWYNG